MNLECNGMSVNCCRFVMINLCELGIDMISEEGFKILLQDDSLNLRDQ